MITLTELARVLNLSKERTKQLVDAALLENASFPIDKTATWQVGDILVQHILKVRGKQIPKNLVITTKSAKGGVGGTTLLFETAVYLSKFLKVLVLDADPEAHLSNLLYLPDINYTKIKCLYDIYSEKLPLESAIINTKYPNLQLIPSALRMHKIEKLLAGQNPKKILRNKIDELGTDFNVIFIDLPPTLGTTLVMSSYLAADLICLPCTPSVFSLESIALTKEAIERLCREFDVPEKRFKIIYNQYSAKTIASQEILSVLLNEYKGLVSPIYIGQSSTVLNSLNAGKSVYEIPGAKTQKEEFANLSLTMLDWM